MNEKDIVNFILDTWVLPGALQGVLYMVSVNTTKGLTLQAFALYAFWAKWIASVTPASIMSYPASQWMLISTNFNFASFDTPA